MYEYASRGKCTAWIADAEARRPMYESMYAASPAATCRRTADGKGPCGAGIVPMYEYSHVHGQPLCVSCPHNTTDPSHYILAISDQQQRARSARNAKLSSMTLSRGLPSTICDPGSILASQQLSHTVEVHSR